MAVAPIWDTVTRQLLRALRGRRSQIAFARRLGYRSNVPAAWEGGHRAPNARELFRVCERVGVDIHAAVTRFHPPAAQTFDPTDGSAWLRALRGTTRPAELARRTQASLPQVRRWLAGRASPRTPQLLSLLDAMTGRAPDLVAELVDIQTVPAVHPRWAAARAQRRLALEHPWTAAARVLIEANPPRVDTAVQTLSAQLSQPTEVVREAVRLLHENELITIADGKYHPAGQMTVDMRATDADRRRLRACWAQAAADRVAAGHPDLFSFSLVSLSRADLERVRQLQRRYFRELRGIVAASTPTEVSALVVAQVATWDAPEPG